MSPPAIKRPTKHTANGEAVIYCRYSPRPGETDSLKVQEGQCRYFATAHKLKVVGVYRDERASGDDANREALWAMIHEVQPGSVIVVSKLDRLARDLALSVLIESEIEKAGCTIMSAAGEGTWEDSPGDRLIRNILKSFAEYERQIIRDRTAAAMRYRKKHGMVIGPRSKVEYGFRVTEEGRVVPDDAEQAAIQFVLALRSKGRSHQGIAEACDAKKHPCRGERWHKSLVGRIITREAARKWKDPELRERCGLLPSSQDRNTKPQRRARNPWRKLSAAERDRRKRSLECLYAQAVERQHEVHARFFQAPTPGFWLERFGELAPTRQWQIDQRREARKAERRRLKEERRRKEWNKKAEQAEQAKASGAS